MNSGLRAGLVGSAVILALAGCGGGGDQSAQAPAAAPGGVGRRGVEGAGGIGDEGARALVGD